MNTCKRHLAIETRPNFRTLLLFSDGKIEQNHNLFLIIHTSCMLINSVTFIINILLLREATFDGAETAVIARAQASVKSPPKLEDEGTQGMQCCRCF